MPFHMFAAIAYNNPVNYDPLISNLLNQSNEAIVVPGEVISFTGTNLITGHGTYRNVETLLDSNVTQQNSTTQSDDNVEMMHENIKGMLMKASLAGRVKTVNKLVYVEPPKARYSGNVGDTVVGRIIEVEQRRWRVDLNSFQVANLALANVKLPGGELRRKSEDDERAMRSYMKEGDLIVAEVHEVYKDGSLQLHMPGRRSGKLIGGCLLRLPPACIKRQKMHRHRLLVPRGSGGDVDADGDAEDYVGDSEMSGGGVNSRRGGGATGLGEGGSHLDNVPATAVGLILGCNGLVWVGLAAGADWSSPDTGSAMDAGGEAAVVAAAASKAGGNTLEWTWSGEDDADDASAVATSRRVAVADRLAVSRVRNCVLALARHRLPVWETSVLAACEASWLEERRRQQRLRHVGALHRSVAGHEDEGDEVLSSVAGLLRQEVSKSLCTVVAGKLGESF